MRSDDDVIELLNEVLTAELTAINQYFVHAKMCDELGLPPARTSTAAPSRSTR